ncbi:MAG TPA: iron-containing alcohol dehydrogenase [Opitutaceae bacterium]|jgi:NADP-dependent alcohol dehydrogenase|nr:iron-containing alcohol dehydrogenase [Opitutaceae bacterium]
MENFTYFNPTRIQFGRGQIASIDKELPAGARVLLLAGQNSIRANGVLAQAQKALGSRKVVEFFGVEANPDFDTLMKAVDIFRAEKLDWILAVGGGSVLDGAKFVAAAVPHTGDAWDILLTRGEKLTSAIPIGAILTLPGTGSEANGAAVISRRAIKEKLAFISPLVFPRFSVLDPETTMTLPERQIANGVGDAFTHVIEQYLTFPANAAIQDRFAESVMRVLIDEGPKSVKDPSNYDARANVVWAATWALNGAISAGVPQDWASHVIGHELTALHGIDHARTLAVVVPSLMNVQRAAKGAKILQFGERVWGIRNGTEDERISQAIEMTRGFYEGLGLRTRLADYDVKPTVGAEVARRLEARGAIGLGERGDITPSVVERILVEAA